MTSWVSSHQGRRRAAVVTDDGDTPLDRVTGIEFRLRSSIGHRPGRYTSRAAKSAITGRPVRPRAISAAASAQNRKICRDTQTARSAPAVARIGGKAHAPIVAETMHQLRIVS